jgi:hypothetical protein
MDDLEHRIRWVDRKDKRKDPLDFFYENYGPTVTRKELYELDSALYEFLRVKGLLEKIPKASKYGDDPLRYYEKNHKGVTRDELRKIDNGFYQKLLRERLLDYIPFSQDHKK